MNWMNHSTSSDFVVPRRNHACTSFNKYMLVHGGIDQQGQILKDIWGYNLEYNKWVTIQIDGEIAALSHHTMTAIFTNPWKIGDIYSKRSCDRERVFFCFI